MPTARLARFGIKEVFQVEFVKPSGRMHCPRLIKIE
jgi:hypothetical protein